MSSNDLRTEISSAHRKISAAKLQSLKTNLKIEPEVYRPAPRARRPLGHPSRRKEEKAENNETRPPSEPVAVVSSHSTPKYSRRSHDPGQQVMLRPVTRSFSQVREPQPHQYRQHVQHVQPVESFPSILLYGVWLANAVVIMGLIYLFFRLAVDSSGSGDTGGSRLPSSAVPGELEFQAVKSRPLYNNQVLNALDQASG